MLPKDLPQDIEILIIVITRSESPNLRKLFRHIYGNAYNTDVNSFNLTFKYKLIFLFAIDDLATFMEEKNIIIENEKHQDMIIPMTEDQRWTRLQILQTALQFCSKNMPNFHKRRFRYFEGGFPHKRGKSAAY